MRVGFLTTEYVTEPTFAGGFSNYVYRIGQLLANRGHEVHVITHSLENGKCIHDGVFVHQIASGPWRERLNRFFLHKAPQSCLWLNFSYRAFLYIKKLHSEMPFDILQFPNLHGCGLFSSFFLNIPYVVRISTYAPIWNKLQGREKIFDYRLNELLEWIQLRKAQQIFSPSILLKHLVKKRLGKNHIEIIPTPFFLEVEKYDRSIYLRYLSRKQYILFFAGRLARHKGPQILAHALPKILSRHLDLMVVFVGRDVSYAGKTMRCHIRTVCEDFKDRLLFLDTMPHSQLYPLIKHAKVVVLPSLIDNMPNACLEAMGLGGVVIGTAGASFEEIIEDGVSGFLVHAGDCAHLEEVLGKVLLMEDTHGIRAAAQKAIENILPITRSHNLNHFILRSFHICEKSIFKTMTRRCERHS